VVCRADHTAQQVDALAALLAGHVRSPRAPGAARRAAVTCVAGTDTGVGKTVVSALLLRASLRLGPARYWKPLQTGDDDDRAVVHELSGAPEATLLKNHARFPLPASPHEAAAAAGDRVDPAALHRDFENHREVAADRLLVEFAGGLHVPVDMRPPLLQLDWLVRMRADVVLVARSGLGTLNHTLLSLESLRARGVHPRALFLVGDPHPRNVATLRQLAGVELVFELPPLDPLSAASLDAWLSRNDVSEVFDG
jgi:dethiobiotin synthetase